MAIDIRPFDLDHFFIIMIFFFFFFFPHCGKFRAKIVSSISWDLRRVESLYSGTNRLWLITIGLESLKCISKDDIS